MFCRKLEQKSAIEFVVVTSFIIKKQYPDFYYQKAIKSKLNCCTYISKLNCGEAATYIKRATKMSK